MNSFEKLIRKKYNKERLGIGSHLCESNRYDDNDILCIECFSIFRKCGRICKNLTIIFGKEKRNG